MRERLVAAHLAKTGLSRQRLANIKSNTLAALKCAGVAVVPSKAPNALTPEWVALMAKLDPVKLQRRLSRFAHFCSAAAILPSDVSEASFCAFEEMMKRSLRAPACGDCRALRRAWNSAAENVEGWPGYRTPCITPKRRYGMTWESFPPSFAADAEAFLAARANPNPFADDYVNPVAASTAALRRTQILALASALVASGYRADQITTLASLTQIENAKAALFFLWERAGRSRKSYLGQQATLLKTLAKYWTKSSAGDVEKLRSWVASLGVRNTGMVAKNRRKLQQFDVPGTTEKLLCLPDKVFAELARRRVIGPRDAARGTYAMAVGLLLVTPIRIDNLVALTLGEDLTTVSRGHSTVMHLTLAAAKTKNRTDYEAEISSGTLALLRRFISTVRPHLSDVPSPWLFPNAQGGRRNTIAFSRGVSEFLAREIGVEMNPHLFRHFAVLLSKQANPHDTETPRQLLGHRSSATTERAYALMDSAAAFRRHDALIASLRAQATRVTPKR